MGKAVRKIIGKFMVAFLCQSSANPGRFHGWMSWVQARNLGAKDWKDTLENDEH